MGGEVADALRRPRGGHELVPALAVRQRSLEGPRELSPVVVASQMAHLRPDNLEVGHGAPDDHVVDPLAPQRSKPQKRDTGAGLDHDRTRDRGDPCVAAG